MSPLLPLPELNQTFSDIPSSLHWLVSRQNTTPNHFLAIHELCHLTIGLLCGGQVWSICIDPNDGGATTISGLMRTTPRVPNNPYALPTMAQLYWSASAVATLSAGYVGSSIVGWLFIVSGLDIVASKIAALVIHIGMLVPILRADSWVAFGSIIICEAVLIGLWFGDHGSALRYYVLFLGVMNLFYSVWDYVDEALYDKRNSSDCSQFSHLLGWPRAGESGSRRCPRN
ncbi:hypothetical protein TREMEDRAFT_33284 [Tremella mesenterica DSM 1558]|uniref:uncharacterized protein n=1 Tax=Tremella mesenterica (strain ATCC 24925 / CBS 8224 / DSM 1558 / NBRC 9311 / NRRL Y-6157 / RJB 2259-6 / UBC 559-6) TaxID=578456 RepID=UPI0003F48F33|nr:uncharacterized protein TREMEDRAFT_33284 [Tremella mesenterica DSM 1558]EIW67725.1 hypothetical protein TREMEDRAFT_33284 [Tremella mesenterica DSM 1558]